VKPPTKKKLRLNEIAKKASDRRAFLDRIRADSGLDLTNENIRLPAKYNETKIANYMKKANTRFSRRTGAPSARKRAAYAAAQQMGIDPKYIKFTKDYNTTQKVIDAAIIRRNANSKKKGDATVKKTAKKDLFRARVRAAAAANGIQLLNEDIKISASASNATLQQIVNASKKRYYARQKMASPFEAQVLQAAQEQGINQKYVKFLRSHKTMDEVLKAARTRQNKNTAKTSKSSLRERILAQAFDTFQADEKAVRSAICVRPKA